MLHERWSYTYLVYRIELIALSCLFDDGMKLIKVPQSRRRPIHEAAEKNSFEVAELLIRSGFDFHVKDQVCVPIVDICDDSHRNILVWEYTI